MYTPLQPGVPRSLKHQITYREIETDARHAEIVQCFWILHTRKTLKENFKYLVLPDGCIDVVFDVSTEPRFDGALVTTRGITASEFNLGVDFAYVGIRFRPGAWLTSPTSIVGELKRFTTFGRFDFQAVHSDLTGKGEHEQLQILGSLIDKLEERGIIGKNDLTRLLLKRGGFSVEELVDTSGYSRRHMQRLLYDTTGYRPHDFVKIVRFQQALQAGTFDAYSDQSHYIREHKRITGMTPKVFDLTYGQ